MFRCTRHVNITDEIDSILSTNADWVYAAVDSRNSEVVSMLMFECVMIAVMYSVEFYDIIRLQQSQKIQRKEIPSNVQIVKVVEPYTKKCQSGKCQFVLHGDIRKLVHARCVVCGHCEYCVMVQLGDHVNDGCIFCGKTLN